MDIEKLKQRIEERKILGMSAAEFDNQKQAERQLDEDDQLMFVALLNDDFEGVKSALDRICTKEN